MSMRKLVQAAALLAGFSATSTAAAQTPAAPAATPHPAPAPAPVRARDLNQSANDTVDMSIALRPRWTFNRMLQLRAGIAFSYEFTNADNTTTRNEPRFGDMNLDLWITGIPPLGGAVTSR